MVELNLAPVLFNAILPFGLLQKYLLSNIFLKARGLNHSNSKFIGKVHCFLKGSLERFSRIVLVSILWLCEKLTTEKL